MRNLTRRRTLTFLIAIAAIIAIAVALVFRAQSPPEAARLLPEADAIVYVHLKTIRTLTHFDAEPVRHSPEYQHFIDATGIDPERDLDAVAFALHRMPDPHGPNGPVAYSEVFTGRFDAMRLAKYLASVAVSKENYAGHDIYTVPSDGRLLRIAQVGYDTLAASNMPTPEQIHSMVERQRTSALGTPGSSLLATRFREVPLLSQAWAIGHIGLPFSQDGKITVLGMQLPLSEDTDFVGSVRWSGSVHVRIEEIAPDEAAAKHTVETLSALLGLLRGIEDAQPARTPAANAMHALLDSATLEQRKQRAVLTATATTDELRALATSGAAVQPTAQPDSPSGPTP